MKTWLVGGMTAIALLSGCSSQPEVTRATYLLPPTSSSVVAANPTPLGQSQALLVVRPVEMAAHLAGMGLVYQVSETEIVQAQQNTWADSIAQQLTRRITADLRAKQKRYWPSELTPAMSSAGQAKLQVKFTQFNGRYTGNAALSGEYLVIDKEGKLQGVYPFQLQVPLAQSGYDAQVSALSQGVDQLTTQIAQRLMAK
ncbi:PqiC family protein [Photobacterium kagoshimensis]|uniref:PqiC family protein n=1 Tax=Photobacterium kagoshimensis TaxID=2910242 RepID=UPI003D105606